MITRVKEHRLITLGQGKERLAALNLLCIESSGIFRGPPVYLILNISLIESNVLRELNYTELNDDVQVSQKGFSEDLPKRVICIVLKL